jgi:hypothetical protein
MRRKYYRWRYKRAHKKYNSKNIEKFGLKWYATYDFGGFGGDITLLPISLTDIREYVASQPKPVDRALVTEDKSSKVEFKRHDDGNIYMYRDGVMEEFPVRGLGVKD